MSIIHDYASIAAQMKGDTWWLPENPAKEPDRRAIEEAAFIQEMAASSKVGHTFIVRTRLPPTAWRLFKGDQPAG